MTRAPLILIVLGLVAAATSVGAEDIYKWVDEQGRVHFGGQPPLGSKATKMAPMAEPAPAASAPTWRQELGQSNMRRLQKRQKEGEEARNRQQTEQRCLSAQRSLDTLNRGGAVYRVNAQGERDYLSDEQRQAAVEAANQRVAAYCR